MREDDEVVEVTAAGERERVAECRVGGFEQWIMMSTPTRRFMES